MDGPSLKGQLLVATPHLRDSSFDRTVVLVVEHDDDGAVGVVLNRPTDTEVARPLPQWGDLAAHPPSSSWAGRWPKAESSAWPGSARWSRRRAGGG